MHRPVLSSALLCLLFVILAACDSTDNDSASLEEIAINDVVEGNGTAVSSGDIVSIRYEVRSFINQTVYDTSEQGQLFDISQHTGVFTFIQGTEDAIVGLNEGILGMKGGGVREISIPFNEAWGRGIAGVVPAQSDILMEIELLKRPTVTLLEEGDGEDIDALRVVGLGFESDFFDTRPFPSADHDPYFFTVGRGFAGSINDSFPRALSKISGLHLLLQDMKGGGVYQIAIPPELALGSQPILGVPANTTIEAKIIIFSVN